MGEQSTVSSTARAQLFSFILMISCSSWFQQTSAADVFASSAHLKVLSDGERNLILSLRQYIDSERNRLDLIERLRVLRPPTSKINMLCRTLKELSVCGYYRSKFNSSMHSTLFLPESTVHTDNMPHEVLRRTMQELTLFQRALDLFNDSTIHFNNSSHLRMTN